MIASEILRATRDYVEDPERWWRPGDEDHPTKMAVCLGPLSMSDEAVPSAAAAAFRCLNRSVPSGYASAWDYDGAPSITHPDVLSLLDRAIALADQENS